MFGESKLNLVLIVGAVLVILVGWQFLMPVFFPQPEIPPHQKAPTQHETTASQIGDGQIGGVSATDSAPMAVRERSEAIANSQRVTIDGRRVRGTILLKGARFDDVVLKDYREQKEEDSPNIVMLNPRNTEHPYFAEFGWTQDSNGTVKLPDSDAVWQTDRTRLTTDSPVTLTWDNGEGIVFKRKISLDENFLFTTEQTLENKSDQVVNLSPYGLVVRYDTPAAGMTSMFAVNSEEFVPWGMFGHGGLGVLQGVKQEFSYEDMREIGKSEIRSNDGWVGITGKYWLSALIPDPDQAIIAKFEHTTPENRDRYQVDYRWEDEVVVQPNTTRSISNHLFVGAKEFNLLDAYEGTIGVRDFDSAVDFGLVWFLARPLYYPIDFFYRAVGNFGVAILLLTICVRIVLYPLANKAYASMSKLRKLQPDTIMLRERYKDDKAKMNTEMMALYRREKANPMAGCLPMLVQIPIFFALYSVLFATIEMRHAPFFLWIDDLSAPDPLVFITVFGLLEWPAPEFLLIGIWPILFAVTMLLQMKLNPQPVEPLQQKIMMLLPIVFLFMFARFPSGLVVYWTWNNVLSIAQQWLIMRRMGITRASLAADAEKIKKIKEQAEAGTLPLPSRSRPSANRKRKRPADKRGDSAKRRKPSTLGERNKPKERKERKERAPALTPRKKSFREQAEEMRREKLRRKRRKAQEAEAKKRTKRRAAANPKSKLVDKNAEEPAEKKSKLSRRQRRAAQAEKREKEGASRKENEDDTWQEGKKPSSRPAKGKKPAPKR